jgi:hypothetical protein
MGFDPGNPSPLVIQVIARFLICPFAFSKKREIDFKHLHSLWVAISQWGKQESVGQTFPRANDLCLAIVHDQAKYC